VCAINGVGLRYLPDPISSFSSWFLVFSKGREDSKESDKRPAQGCGLVREADNKHTHTYTMPCRAVLRCLVLVSSLQIKIPQPGLC
jgi:hypothetical protein